MTVSSIWHGRCQLGIVLSLACNFLSGALSASSFSHLHENVRNTTTMALPLDDFNLIPSCDVAGVIAKFQSWGHRKSDEISGRLTSLAQDMIEYSKFHHIVISSWRGASPEKVVGTFFMRCIENQIHVTAWLIQVRNFIVTKQYRTAAY